VFIKLWESRVYIFVVFEKERENLWIFRYWIVGNAVVS
jgi:hypothetical protein